jgi:uncharacterized membrane protein
VAIEAAGVRKTHTVTLRTGNSSASLGSVELTTDLPSLEGVPGGSVQYALQLTNRGAERLVALSVPDLPGSYAATFTVGGSRVQTVQLDAGASRDIALNVGIPSLGNASIANAVHLTANVSSLDDGRVLASLPLILTVTGAERLELSGRNWFASTTPGSPVEATLTLRNTGTAAAFGIVLAAEAPSGWDAEFDPARVERLGAGESVDVTLRALTAATTAEGRYVLDVSARSSASAARERSFSVEVAQPEGPSQLPWLLAAGVAVVGGIAVIVYLRRK